MKLAKTRGTRGTRRWVPDLDPYEVLDTLLGESEYALGDEELNRFWEMCFELHSDLRPHDRFVMCWQLSKKHLRATSRAHMAIYVDFALLSAKSWIEFP